MMKKILPLCLSVLTAMAFTVRAADDSSQEIEKTDVVPSGTYTGTALKVDAEEQEVYVQTSDHKILELYFKNDTKLMKDGKEVPFTTLKKGEALEVKVEKKGSRLRPLEVTIIEEKR